MKKLGGGSGLRTLFHLITSSRRVRGVVEACATLLLNSLVKPGRLNSPPSLSRLLLSMAFTVPTSSNWANISNLYFLPGGTALATSRANGFFQLQPST
jgi:hypothetical protein